MKVNAPFQRNIERILGDGMQTLFWEDVWIRAAPLAHKLPRLYSICYTKQVIVQFVKNSGWGCLTFRRSLWVEPTAEMEEMKNMVHDIQLSDCKDMVAWKIGTNNFLVKRVFIYKSKQVMWLVIGKFGNLKCPSRLKYSCGY